VTADFGGKVALVTGGARGMGRSHAVAFAAAGADVAICDRCEDRPTVPYPLGTEADLAETERLIEATGRRCVSAKVDTTDRPALEAFVAGVEEELGRVDIAVANAGVSSPGMVHELPPEVWDEVIGSNLTGVFHTIGAVAPGMMQRRYGRIVTVSSMMGRGATWNMAAYGASKWGVIGLTKSAAHDLSGHGITVNAVAPGNVDTPMVQNDFMYSMMRPDLETPGRDDIAAVMASLHLQHVPWLDPAEVTRVVLFLAAEASAHLTGIVVPVDAGASARVTA
jgi:SDR family mycofactocin-dependent oxidoreductase